MKRDKLSASYRHLNLTSDPDLITFINLFLIKIPKIYYKQAKLANNATELTETDERIKQMAKS